MNTYDIILLSSLIFIAALLYSSVGHGGASGYLAAMALFGLAPAVMKPTALSLNVFVAGIAAIQFYRAKCFSWSVLLPFVITSIPFAFLGGALSLPNPFYRKIVGLVLLFAAFQLFRYTQRATAVALKPIPIFPAILLGAGIGLLSGLTGVGGGIFLSPLLLFMGWADARQTAGVSAAFILVNSAAGIMGHVASVKSLPDSIPFLIAAAVFGGLIGSGFGSRRFSNIGLRRLLAVVLVIAAAKFILS